MSSTPSPAATRTPNRPLYVTVAELLIVAACTIAFLLTAAGVVYSLVQTDSAGNCDFVEYWTAAQQLLHHKSPYDPAAMRSMAKLVGYPAGQQVVVLPNPPIVLPWILPLASFSALHGLWFWCGLLLCSWVSSIWITNYFSARPIDPMDLLALTFAPGLICLAMGQISIIVGLGLVLFLNLHDRWPFVAGAGLACCMLKPHLLLPFAAVFIVWTVGRKCGLWIFAGAGAVLIASALIATALDHHVWTEYTAMMQSVRVDRAPIPCLSNALRRVVSPKALWIQYVPSVLACTWALDYYRRRRNVWCWSEHGPLLILVSVVVAPYSWIVDQAVVLPAIAFGLRVTESRLAVCLFAVANAIVQLSIFSGGQRLLHAPWLLWTAPFWLLWFVAATRQQKSIERGGIVPVIAAAD